jgi:hypothetical protein
MAKFKIEKTNTVNEYFDATNVVGGTGGLFNTLTPTVVSPNVYLQGGTKGAAGSIIRSKGRGKFQVADSTSLYPNAMTSSNAYAIITTGNTNYSKFTSSFTSYSQGDIINVINGSSTDVSTGIVNLVGVATLTNVPGQNLTTGQASLPVYLNAFTANVGNLGASGATTFISVIFANANVVGVSKPTIGSSFANLALGIVGNATVTSIAAYGTNGSNANVAISSQTVANVASATINTTIYAARLTNKTVTDFNNNKYLWTFNAPTATTVQLQGN